MTKTTDFNFKGARCANGIIRAKKAIAAVAGAGKATVDLANHLVRVEGDADPDAIIKALIQANFEASIKSDD